MTLAHWKTVKWLTYLAAMVVIGMAIDAGADPFWAIVAAAFILGGPEFLEYLAVQKYDLGNEDNSNSSD